MPPRQLFATSSLVLHHDPARACLYASWQKRRLRPDSPLTFQHILLGVQQTQSTKLLNDWTLAADGWQLASTWLTQGYFEELAQAGVRTIAWVLPDSTPTLHHIREQLQAVTPVLVDTFLEAVVAYEWLHK
jgi:hypothetical protein